MKSSAEAKYQSMSSASSEIIWLRRHLHKFGVPVLGSTSLFVDNTSVIRIGTNSIFHERMKHIEVDYHFNLEQVDVGYLHLPQIAFHYKLADPFTKAMTKSRHDFLAPKLMPQHSPHQFEGECK